MARGLSWLLHEPWQSHWTGGSGIGHHVQDSPVLELSIAGAVAVKCGLPSEYMITGMAVTTKAW